MVAIAARDPKTGQILPRDKQIPLDPELVEFYAPDRPDERIMVEGRIDPAHFTGGFLATKDPAVIAAVRRGVQAGLYYEADSDTTITCDQCGAKFRNQKAFVRHTRREQERQAHLAS